MHRSGPHPQVTLEGVLFNVANVVFKPPFENKLLFFCHLSSVAFEQDTVLNIHIYRFRGGRRVPHFLWLLHNVVLGAIPAKFVMQCDTSAPDVCVLSKKSKMSGDLKGFTFWSEIICCLWSVCLIGCMLLQISFANHGPSIV